MAEKKPALIFSEEKSGQWSWTLHTSGDPFLSSDTFSNRPSAVNNFLLLISLGNVEISRALQSGEAL